MDPTLINLKRDHYRVKELEATRTYNLQPHLPRQAIPETDYALAYKGALVGEAVPQTHLKAHITVKADMIGSIAVEEEAGRIHQPRNRGRMMVIRTLRPAAMTHAPLGMTIQHINNGLVNIDESERACDLETSTIHLALCACRKRVSLLRKLIDKGEIGAEPNEVSLSETASANTRLHSVRDVRFGWGANNGAQLRVFYTPRFPLPEQCSDKCLS